MEPSTLTRHIGRLEEEVGVKLFHRSGRGMVLTDSGAMLLQETIDGLQTRFRTVDVTLSAVKELPRPLPDGWLVPEIEGHRLRFICARHEDDAYLYQQLTQHFGAVKMTAEPMSLRAIATALMQQRKRELGR